MPRLTASELQSFLDEPGHLVHIGTTDADGMPRVAPTWFLYRKAEILFTPRLMSVFLANIGRDDKLCLCIDEESLPYRKIVVQGRARIVHQPGDDDAWRDTYRAIAQRYIAPDAAEAYIQNTIDQPRALIAVSLAECRVTTWRMPLAGESGTGIWARRYYAHGSKMAQRADTSA